MHSFQTLLLKLHSRIPGGLRLCPLGLSFEHFFYYKKYLNGSHVMKKVIEMEKRITFVFRCFETRLGRDTRLLCNQMFVSLL